MTSTVTPNAATGAPPAPAAESCATVGWPLERVLFTMAGTATLASAAGAAKVSRRILWFTAFIGANQLLFAAIGTCPASIVLRRALGLRSTIFPAGR